VDKKTSGKSAAGDGRLGGFSNLNNKSRKTLTLSNFPYYKNNINAQFI